MKIFFHIVFMLMVLIPIGESQNLPDRAGFRDGNNNLKTQNISVKVKPHKSNLEDSPYLFTDDRLGYAIPKSGEHTETLYFNYNILLEQTVFRKDGELYSIDNKYLDSLVILQDGKQGIYCFKKIRGDDKAKLVELLCGGTYPLYRHIEASLVQPDYNPILMTGSQNFTIDTNKKYVVDDNGNFLYLPNSAKKIQSSSEFSPEFKKQVRQKKPKLKREKDIIAFFQYVNGN